jgi:phosphoribosylamine--glycine ligase
MNGAGFASTRTYVGALEDGRDMVALLELEAARWPYPEPPDLVLMAHVQGVEVGVGAFFDGRAFLAPANLDWEHKRFFPGDLGELTGEMGTLVTYRGAERLFGEVLAPVAPLLASSGYRGYVNVNTIVNERGVWPLEFTCRFGYPGFAVLDALHAEPWDAILQRLVHPAAGKLSGRIRTHAGYSVGVVLTVPPFPYPHGYELLSKGMPVCFRGELDGAMRDRLHYGEVAMAGGRLVTSGMVGYVMVVTGRGRTVRSAQRQAYDAVDRVVIPKARWRRDIGDRFVREDRRALESLGYLPARERAA